LRTLITSVKRDQTAGKPLKHYRELFRAVREIIVKPSATEDTE
jgi:ribosomal 50S subunit-associated protein YjgA (DUF615 family)